MKAIYYQTYKLAKRELASWGGAGAKKPLAVVLDIDETVLDNSPQSAQQIIDNEPFSMSMWDEWCNRADAEPLPGALDFTMYATKLGVEVFYISNRSFHLLDASLENLKNAGFPFADSAHVLLKTDTSAKDARREKVRETHEIVMLIGDNLGDFSGLFDNRMEGSDHSLVEEYRDSFGSTFIILPNPIYGGWEKQYRGESPEETNRNKKEALNTFRN